MIDIKVKKLSDAAQLPTKATSGSSGYDVYATQDADLSLGGFFTMPLGIAVEVPLGYELQLRPRSGLAAKYGITIVNTPGTIDSDYRGEVKALLHRLAGPGGYNMVSIKTGDRIGQLVLVAVPESQIVEVTELTPSDRDNGGFGSSGT